MTQTKDEHLYRSSIILQAWLHVFVFFSFAISHFKDPKVSTSSQ